MMDSPADPCSGPERPDVLISEQAPRLIGWYFPPDCDNDTTMAGTDRRLSPSWVDH